MKPLALAVIATLHLSCFAQSPSLPCNERAKWLAGVTQTRQDSVLAQVSLNTMSKFAEIMSAKDRTPTTELWAYKLVSFSHYQLAKIPDQSPALRDLFLRIETVNSSLIKGQIAFPEFKRVITTKMVQLDARTTGRSADEREFMQRHSTEIERLSNCIIITAMHSGTDLPAK